jgi:sugar phosphate isomerase/epimerase
MLKLLRILKLVTSLALVSAVLSGAAGSETKARHYLIGLQLYTVRDVCAKDFPGTLQAVAKIGFSGVEFAGYYGRTAQELRKMLDEDHLKCYGSHIGLDDLLGDNFDKTVAFNKVLGNHLLVVPGLDENRRNSRAALIDTAHLFSQLAKKLKPYGIMLGYHNHELEFTPMEGELPWDTFFGNSDPDVVIQFDIGNALQGGVQAAPFLSKYPGRVVSVHVKDYSATDNDHTLLGQGDEHWNDVMPILKAKNGPRWFIVEQETYPFPSLVCAEKCFHTLENMLGLQTVSETRRR